MCLLLPVLGIYLFLSKAGTMAALFSRKMKNEVVFLAHSNRLLRCRKFSVDSAHCFFILIA